VDGKPLGKKERKRLEKAARRAAVGAPSGRARLQKAAVNVMLVCLLSLFAIDALPASTALHARLQLEVDDVLDVTGLWQGRWNLFAPEPDKVNTWISAEFTYPDGSVRRWRSPDWRGLGVFERKRLFRHMEYFDNIRLSDNRKAWAALAQWLAVTEGRQASGGPLPVRVELTRHKNLIPPPPPGLGLLDRVELGELPDEHDVFYTCWRQP
jgi:hypothetical protein